MQRTSSPDRRVRGWSIALLWLAASSASASRPPEDSGSADREAIAEFEREVRPILAEHCYECHGPEAKRAKGGLRFGSRKSLLEGGDSGPAVSESEPGSSLLLRAIAWTDPDLEMPPDGKLGADEIAKLTKWVERGAVWPDETGDRHLDDESEGTIDLDEGRRWWSFRPIERPAVPNLPESTGIRNPIDAFVRAKLLEAGLTPAAEADRRTLARRTYFDLIGLPPTKEEVDRFVADARDDAFERLVDDLLARPEYGERWARHWLDVVRYADTNGYERDEAKPYAWRYRDYVIEALNADLPYDRFLIEQIAGDEVEPKTVSARLATGMLRIGAWDSEPDDEELAKYDELDDSLRVISEGFLGITVGCARCHDHKFDPIPQTDYYGMLAFLRSIRPYEQDSTDLDPPAVDILDKSPASLARYDRERKEAFDDLQRRIEEIKNRGRKLVLAKRLESMGESKEILDLPPSSLTAAMRRSITKALALEIPDQEIYDALGKDEARGVKRLLDEQRLLPRRFQGSVERGLVAKEYGRRAIPTSLLIRGQPRSPGPEISPRFPLVLAPTDEAAIPDLTAETNRFRESTGRRLQLARWIASPTNPLTARVIVNRVFRAHFGRGIVDTPNDFGRMGDPPSHPELLDWLASEFVERGWSLKWLHRTILSSATWRQRSDVVNESATTLDPDNRLLWRQNPRRLEAEAIRDAMLAVSGRLIFERGGPGFFPTLDRNVLAGSSRPGEGWGISNDEERRRRSIYAFSKRNLPVPILEVFDAANSTLPIGARATTTVATQALSLLNGSFSGEIATALGQKIATETSDDSVAPSRLFESVLGRAPSDDERRLVDEYFEFASRHHATRGPTTIIEAKIPRRVSDVFLADLRPSDILRSPETGFTLVRGRFDNPYNVTVEMNELQGPAALWDGATVRGGEVSTCFRLRDGSPFGSLVVRATTERDGLVGIELRLDRDRMRLLHHTASESIELGAAEVQFVDRWTDLRVSLADGRIRVFVDRDETPRIDVADPTPGESGAAGFRTRDDGIQVRALTVIENGETRDLGIEQAPARERALADLALLLINSNEFVFVD